MLKKTRAVATLYCIDDMYTPLSLVCVARYITPFTLPRSSPGSKRLCTGMEEVGCWDTM